MKKTLSQIARAALLTLAASSYSYAQGGFELNGQAAAINGCTDCYQLTPDAQTKFGSMWYNKKADLSKDFDITAQLYFGTHDAGGADGISFTFQNYCTSAGTVGSGLGIAGVSPSLIVEFDTYQNANDPIDDHIAIEKNGNLDHNSASKLAGPVSCTAGNANVEDGTNHVVRITWNATSKTLKVYFEGVERLSYQGDVVTNIFAGNPYVYWGFTAATGYYTNEHRVSIQSFPTNVVKLNDVAICAGDTARPIMPGGVTYDWTPNTNILNGNTSSPKLFPTISAKYIVAITDSCGNIQKDSMMVNVNPLPSVTLSNFANVCSNTALFTLSGGLPAGGTYSGVGVSAGKFDAAVAGVGSHVITYTYTNGNGCTSSDAKTIVVNAAPVVTLANFADACINETQVVLSGGSPSGGVFSGNNVSAGNFNPSLAGVGNTAITYTYTDGNSCVAAQTKNISVNGPPATLSAALPAFCPGMNSIVLTANTVNGATYGWYKDNVEVLSNTSATYTATTAANYKVKITTTDGCFKFSSDVLLNNASNPTAAITSPQNNFCDGLSVLLTATPVTGASYTWYKVNMSGTSIVLGPGSSNMYSVVDGANYYVKVKSTEQCTAQSNTLTITEKTPPTATIQTPANTALCAGTSATLTANVVSGATYEWFKDNASLGAATVDINTMSVSQAGAYKVKINDGCETTSNVVTITVNAAPSAAGIIAGNISICKGDFGIAYSVPAVAGATDYLWEVIPAGKATISSGQGTANIVVDFQAQAVTIKVTPRSLCGTGTASTKTISLSNSCGTGANFGSTSTNTCVGSVVSFTDYSDNAGFGMTPEFDFGSGASPAKAVGAGPHNVTYTTPGQKNVIVNYTIAGNVYDTETRNNYINVSAAPSTSVISGVASIDNCSSYEIYSVIKTVGSSYQWRVNSGATIVSGNGTNSIIVHFANAGSTITVKETNASGCMSSTASKTVTCSFGTSVHEVSNNVGMNVYPNPSEGIVNVELFLNAEQNYSISVLSITGQEVYNSNGFAASGLIKQSIDLSALVQGIYVIRISGESKVFTKNIVIE